MEWLNEGVGLIVLISAIVIVLLLALTIGIVLNLRSRIAVQRLSFLGLYGSDLESHVCYADLTVGNRSLNDVGISEIGIRNGKVSFNLTSLYKQKEKLGDDARIVIEQRGALRLRLNAAELLQVLTEDKNGKKTLGHLRLYAVDLTGNCYRGSVKEVKRLLSDLMTGRLNENGEPVGASFAPVQKVTAVPAKSEDPEPAEKPAKSEPAPTEEKSVNA